jgi:acetoin utilization deacetylase AcuC-like enzyme
MTTALLTHEDCLNHVTPNGHPEQVARLAYILKALEPLDLMRIDAPLADDDPILRCHPQSHIDRLTSLLPTLGSVSLDADTHMSAGSVTAARRGVGAITKAVDMVMDGTVGNAFCATRPPGHHAETETPMGFCLFGTVAIGAKHALDHHGLERVAVVDFDVHHGNGTQDLLWNEPRALAITSQQMPLWPGSGNPSDKGAHDNIVNLPLDPGSTGAVMRQVYETKVFPRLRSFKPDMIFISAGFDAHQDDPLAGLNWSTDDFAWVTGQLCALADELCDGRLVSTLEGGYDLDALASATKAHVSTLIEAAK